MPLKTSPRKTSTIAAGTPTIPPLAVPAGPPSTVSARPKSGRLNPSTSCWRARTIPTEQAADEWHRLAAVLDLYAVENHFGSLDALETVPLASLMDSVVNAFPDSARFLLGLVDRYLHFLAETGHWKRSQGDLSALHILFACGESPLCHRSPLRQSGVVITDPQQLPLVRWAAAVIQGLGEPKPGYPSISTDTGISYPRSLPLSRWLRSRGQEYPNSSGPWCWRTSSRSTGDGHFPRPPGTTW